MVRALFCRKTEKNLNKFATHPKTHCISLSTAYFRFPLALRNTISNIILLLFPPLAKFRQILHKFSIMFYIFGGVNRYLSCWMNKLEKKRDLFYQAFIVVLASTFFLWISDNKLYFYFYLLANLNFCFSSFRIYGLDFKFFIWLIFGMDTFGPHKILEPMAGPRLGDRLVSMIVSNCW